MCNNGVRLDLDRTRYTIEKIDFDDDFVSCLQESIRRIKSSWKMEERFMVLEEMLKEALRENWPDFDEEISTCQIGCTIGVHTGPTAFGISAIRKVSD